MTPPQHQAVEQDLVDRVLRAWRELRRGAATRRLRERIYAGEIELGQYDGLATVAMRGPLRMQEVADSMRVDASTATRVINRLEDAGLVQRAASPDDARRVVVSVTDQGRDLHGRVARRSRDAMREIFDDFTAEEAELLAALLERWVAAIDTFTTRDDRDRSPRHRRPR